MLFVVIFSFSFKSLHKATSCLHQTQWIFFSPDLQEQHTLCGPGLPDLETPNCVFASHTLQQN